MKILKSNRRKNRLIKQLRIKNIELEKLNDEIYSSLIQRNKEIIVLRHNPSRFVLYIKLHKQEIRNIDWNYFYSKIKKLDSELRENILNINKTRNIMALFIRNIGYEENIYRTIKKDIQYSNQYFLFEHWLLKALKQDKVYKYAYNFMVRLYNRNNSVGTIPLNTISKEKLVKLAIRRNY